MSPFSALGATIHLSKPNLAKATAAVVMSVGVMTAVSFLAADPVQAHHSWNSQDTRFAYYLQGTVTEVRWGNPHVEVHVRVENTAMPADWSERPLPPGADETDGQLTMASARPYNGPFQELHLTLAPPNWMERWGMNRELHVGERIEAVGFVSTSGDDELRPVMFWLADGQGVWQKLTAFPTPPEPAPPRSN
jgi:hypothetical protein